MRPLHPPEPLERQTDAISLSITTQTEHKCVLDSCRVLQDEGFEVTYLPVQTNGLVDLKLLEESIRPETCLVSVSPRLDDRSVLIADSMIDRL